MLFSTVQLLILAGKSFIPQLTFQNIQKIQPILYRLNIYADLCYFMRFMIIAIAIIMVELFEMLPVCINRLVKYAWLGF